MTLFAQHAETLAFALRELDRLDMTQQIINASMPSITDKLPSILIFEDAFEYLLAGQSVRQKITHDTIFQEADWLGVVVKCNRPRHDRPEESVVTLPEKETVDA